MTVLNNRISLCHYLLSNPVMKKIFLFPVILLSSALLTYAESGENGVTEIGESSTAVEYALEGWFRDIEILGPHIVDYRQGKGDVSMVRYTVPAGMEEYADVSVRGNALVVRWKDCALVASASIVATVCTPRLDRVTVSGSGQIKVNGRLKSNDLKIAVFGQGCFSACGVKSHFIEAVVYGAGKVDISGIKSDILYATVAGDGRIDLAGRTHTCSMDLYGEGGDIGYIGLNVKALNYKRHRN